MLEKHKKDSGLCAGVSSAMHISFVFISRPSFVSFKKSLLKELAFIYLEKNILQLNIFHFCVWLTLKN